LNDPKERKRYNKEYKKHKLKAEDINNKEFASNTSGSDSGTTSTDDSNAKPKEIKPDKYRRAFYQKAISAVETLLSSPKDKDCIARIETINRQIEARNEKEGLDKTAFLINTNVLKSIGIQAATARSRIDKDPDDERTNKLIRDLAEQLQKSVRINLYPTR
jgi:hypothetical protein